LYKIKRDGLSLLGLCLVSQRPDSDPVEEVDRRALRSELRSSETSLFLDGRLNLATEVDIHEQIDRYFIPWIEDYCAFGSIPPALDPVIIAYIFDISTAFTSSQISVLVWRDPIINTSSNEITVI